VEQDLEALNRLIEQLTTLARLEGAGVAAPETIDPVESAQHVVAALAPLVFDSGRTIAFEKREAEPFRGHRALIENALRNLVDNAIRHTGEGATIIVAAGPGPSFSVFDDGGAASRTAGSRVERNGLERPGLGLKIVSRIAEMHGGRLENDDLVKRRRRGAPRSAGVELRRFGAKSLAILPINGRPATIPALARRDCVARWNRPESDLRAWS